MSENSQTTETTPAVTPENLDRWENERIPKSEARAVVNALIAEVRRLTQEAEKPKRQPRKPKETPAEVEAAFGETSGEVG